MTAIEGIEDTKKCPFCGSNIDLSELGRLGLSTEELEIIAKHAREGTLKDMLIIAQIAWRVLDPEKATSEFQVNDAISKLREVSNQSIRTFTQETREFVQRICKENEGDKVQIVREYEQKYKPVIEDLQKEIVHTTRTIEKLEKENQIKYSELNENIKEIREKIVGTGIGNISEMVTIRDLKEVVPTDSFSEARASKGGTDIIATVKEKGTMCGVITISNKCTQKWEGNFLSQLTRDMKDDGSRFGILVTKAFPREALSSKAHLVDPDDGRTMILVKPEYAPFAYFGLREATIHWFESRKVLKRKEDEAEESEKIFKALMAWINGEDFEDSVRQIDSARKAAIDTRRELASMRSRLNLQIDRATKFQDSIEQSLIYATTLIGKLRDLLNSGSSETFS
jgi:Uncharacterized protein conserved in bacteria (DUF2130)